MGAKSSLEILTEFLSEHKIKADPKKHLKKHIVDSDRTIQLQDDIVDRIIADGYDVTSEKVAEIDALLQKKIEFYLGRVQKEQLKTYLTYEDPDDLQQLIKLSGDSFTAEGKKIYKEEVLPKEKITEAVEKFLSKLKEAKIDEDEGVDIIMVKPALPYLDVINQVKNIVQCPVAAYQVSGEYTMIKVASEKGWLDEDKCIIESLTGIKRAGANFIITYFAVNAAQLIKENAE